MLYQLFHPDEAWLLAVNLFKYISFRASFAFLTAFFIGLVFGRQAISMMYRHGSREAAREVTDVVIQDKKGTPTMGGLLIILSIAVSALLWCDLQNVFALWSVAALLFFGMIGFRDDYLKVKHKSSERGLSRTRKLLLQGLFGLVFSLFVYSEATTPFPPAEAGVQQQQTAAAETLTGENPATVETETAESIATNLYLPFFKNPVIDLSWLYILFAIFVFLSISNAVNFADGLDGLAIVPACMTIGVYGIFAYIIGNARYSSYLLFDLIPGTGELTIVAAAVIGAGLGFLWYNAYPAQVFMGDTGSQALGGLTATVALLVKQEFLFLIAGGIFLAEAVSVLLQDRIGIARIGRRIFYRAPLHHAFQFRGIPESTVVVRFWIISVMLALLSIVTLKIR